MCCAASSEGGDGAAAFEAPAGAAPRPPEPSGLAGSPAELLHKAPGVPGRVFAGLWGPLAWDPPVHGALHSLALRVTKERGFRMRTPAGQGPASHRGPVFLGTALAALFGVSGGATKMFCKKVLPFPGRKGVRKAWHVFFPVHMALCNVLCLASLFCKAHLPSFFPSPLTSLSFYGSH